MSMKAKYTYIPLLLFILNGYLVSGDGPLQASLSTFECYKFTQEGCDKDFADVYPQLSRSADNFSVAATRFYMFTLNNPDDPELMHKCGGGLPPNTKFNPNCKTEIIFPGFFSGICTFAIFREIKNERLKCGCYNVLLVDWTWGNSFDLVTGVNNMVIVAKQVAVVIRGLKHKYHLTDEAFICTGHSLGAHGCGYVGQDEPIAVINGLDPAGDYFTQNMPLNQRLDPGDAKRCVQVTHCNAGQCLPNYFGANFTMGTKDIWYNDGLQQPACYKQIFISLLQGDFIYALISLTIPGCPHLQCLYYYKASICTTGCDFIAVKCKNAETFLRGCCNSCGYSGQDCDVAGPYSCDCNNGSRNKKLHNNYFLKTDIDCPYCDNSGIHIDNYRCPALRTSQRRNNLTNIDC